MIKKSDFDKLNSKDPKIKYGFAKELLKMGAESPELLYKHFDRWTAMMASENNIFKWTAIDIIGYLSAADKENKVEHEIPTLYDFLHGGQLISCNHAIFALGIIAKNKPDQRFAIIKELLGIAKDKFDLVDCKDIAMGKVLLTLKMFMDDIKDMKSVHQFVRQAQGAQRPATRKKADALWKKLAAN